MCLSWAFVCSEEFQAGSHLFILYTGSKLNITVAPQSRCALWPRSTCRFRRFFCCWQVQAYFIFITQTCKVVDTLRCLVNVADGFQTKAAADTKIIGYCIHLHLLIDILKPSFLKLTHWLWTTEYLISLIWQIFPIKDVYSESTIFSNNSSGIFFVCVTSAVMIILNLICNVFFLHNGCLILQNLHQSN